jgi:hypothetical protein
MFDLILRQANLKPVDRFVVNNIPNIIKLLNNRLQHIAIL